MALPQSETRLFLQLAPAKQQRILNAAIQEFAAKGYGNASLNRVVQEARISKGSLFTYFRNKSGLFTLVYRMTLERVKNYLRAVRDNSLDDDFFTRLEKILRAGVQFITDHPHLAQIYYRLIYTGDAPYQKEFLKDIHRESLDFMESLIEIGMARNQIRADIDLPTAAFIIASVLDRFLQSHHFRFTNTACKLVDATPAQTECWIKNVIDIFKYGLLNSIDSARQGEENKTDAQ